MDKIEINLALTFKIPDEGINVNGLLHGFKKANSEIMLGIIKTFFKAFEQRYYVKKYFKSQQSPFKLYQSHHQ